MVSELLFWYLLNHSILKKKEEEKIYKKKRKKKRKRKIESLICGLVVEEKTCWLRRNPAFEVVKTDSQTKNLLSFSHKKFPFVCLYLSIGIP